MSTPSTSPDIATLLAALQSQLSSINNVTAQLPDAADLQFEKTLSRSFAKKMNNEADNVLSLINNLLNWADGSQKVVDGEMIREGVYNDVIQRVEGLLEGADDGIEKHLGVGKVVKNIAVGAKAFDAASATIAGSNGSAKPPLPSHILNDPNLPRPQLLFTPRTVLTCTQLPLDPTTIDEQDPVIWQPILQTKRHAKDSTASWLKTEVVVPVPETSRWNEVTRTRYMHPYSDELSTLEPPATYYLVPETPAPTVPTSFQTTPFTWVDNLETLESMIEDIRSVGIECDEAGKGKELAIDLEHHDYRTWGGITCLIQLSTRKGDYVIDALDPIVRDNLEKLNEFLADPDWIKVFHGAASDVIWLQRDFGLYLVGLFDTYHATKLLEYSAHSLASLLERFSNFQADKRYQLADWRIRPIPTEMLHYARSDTHYLLAVYDHLRIALRSHVPTPLDLTIPLPPLPPFALLNETFARSVKTSASVYEQDAYSFSTGLGSEGWRIILKRNRLDKEYLTALAIPTLPLKTGWGPGEIRLEVLRGLHYWRERKSRELDESTNWIIGNRNLIALVEEAKIPRDVVSLMTILGKNRGGVGEMMRKYREEVIEVINQSLERVTVGSKGGAVDPVEVRKATEGGVDRGVGAVEPTVVAAQGLWDEIIAAPAIVATATATVSTSMVDSIRSVASSFFGKSKIVVAPVPVIPAVVEVKASLAASSSSFFGSKDAKKVVVIDRSKAEVRMDIVSSNEAKLAAVARIHNSLVLGGGLANSLRSRTIPTPIAPVASTSQLPPAPPSSAAPAPEGLSADHSYVPLSGRLPSTSSSGLTSVSSTPISKKKNDSEVIVVSALEDRPKKVKRKRTTVPAIEGEEGGVVESSASKKESTKKRSKLTPPVVSEPLEPHDYSLAPSLLDAPSTASLNAVAGISKERKRKDKKDKLAKGFATVEGDKGGFGRAPRVNNAPKKGNLAMSFLK